MKKRLKLRLTVFFAVVLAVSVSCSSVPRDTGDIIHLRSLVEKEMAVAVREAGRGNYETALALLRECKRRAVLVDDMALMVRCGLSLGNVLLTLGQFDEAFAEWEEAVALAQRQGDRELLSVSRIFQARGKLVSGSVSAQTVLDEVTREAANLRTDRLFIAFSWQVRGLALRELRSYREAEDAFKRSLDIHEKERYLENASFDWYTIASVRSLAGNTSGALQALESAIILDRRVENSWGLAANWRAVGDVHRRAGNNSEAIEAYQRSGAIFTAMGNEREVAEISRRIDELF